MNISALLQNLCAEVLRPDGSYISEEAWIGVDEASGLTPAGWGNVGLLFGTFSPFHRLPSFTGTIISKVQLVSG